MGDFDRARALYQLAVKQPVLDMPELIWKAFIDFEIEQEEYERARQLYKILLTRTKHVKVWMSLARFEAGLEEVDEEEGGGAQALERARNVFKEANKVLRLEEADSEQRLMLLQHWKQFEVSIVVWCLHLPCQVTVLSSSSYSVVFVIFC